METVSDSQIVTGDLMGTMNGEKLNAALADPQLDVMNYLNQVVLAFPHAVSFASGRPAEKFFLIDEWMSAVSTYVSYESSRTNRSSEVVKKDLGQYGRTNGIINELIAQMLENDEGILVEPDEVMVTIGCQEGMALCLDALFASDGDVLLIVDPTYIGITGLAAIKGIEIDCIAGDDDGPILSNLDSRVHALRKQGKTPKALYLIPDFSNPLGTSMSLIRRKALLAYCAQEEIFVIEDNPYGMFRFDGDHLPTLKALDTYDIVIYLGTFSKTIAPGLRVGYLIASQKVLLNNKLAKLTHHLSKIKSLLTVNTSQLTQAMVGGILLHEKCSLRSRLAPTIEYYRNNRDVMIRTLASAFYTQPTSEPVTWNCPEGGYFLTVSLPFTFDGAAAEQCARDYGVICTPLSFFSIRGAGINVARLSFSYVTPPQIIEGVTRFGRYVQEMTAKNCQAVEV